VGGTMLKIFTSKAAKQIEDASAELRQEERELLRLLRCTSP